MKNIKTKRVMPFPVTSLYIAKEEEEAENPHFTFILFSFRFPIFVTHLKEIVPHVAFIVYIGLPSSFSSRAVLGT